MTTTEISKTLSYVLRHNPGSFGLVLDEQGWVPVEELLAAFQRQGHALSRAQLQAVVATSDKQRFAFSPDHARIRANQGHSVAVELGLLPLVPPPYLYHGTASRFLGQILTEGLRPGQRQHVHLSADAATAQVVGQRHGRPVVLRVRAGALHATGQPFYQAANGVWLTAAIPPAYLDQEPASEPAPDFTA